jgi:RNA polymerase sigma-70 factor (ECF subfamily)
VTLSPDAEQLIQRTRDGDVQAFHRLYDLYAGKVLNFAYRLTGSRDTAEEVAQETFISVFKNVSTLKDPARFEPWLFQIARNYVYQAYRKRRLPMVSTDETDEDDREIIHLEAAGGSPEDLALKGELREVAQRIIDSLGFKYREVFVLAVIEGFSYQEVAEMLGRKIQSVKTDIHRARLMIRNQLARYLKEGKIGDAV